MRGGDQDGDILPEQLIRFVAIHFRGSPVAAFNRAIERPADDGVIAGVYDGGEVKTRVELRILKYWRRVVW